MIGFASHSKLLTAITTYIHATEKRTPAGAAVKCLKSSLADTEVLGPAHNFVYNEQSKVEFSIQTQSCHLYMQASPE